MAQAAKWTYDTLSRIRGEQGRLYGFGAESKDFTSGLLSADTSNGRKINVQQARDNKYWMDEYLDIVQPLLYQARDNSTSDEARKYFEEQIDEANYARQWYDRAAKGDTYVLDDLTPLFSVAHEEESTRFSINTDDQGLPYDNGDIPFDEMISKGLADLAQKNKDNVELRVRAMRGIGDNLAKLRQAMSLQRTYDRGPGGGEDPALLQWTPRLCIPRWTAHLQGELREQRRGDVHHVEPHQRHTQRKF